MDIPDCWFFQNLRMAKGLADGGYLEPFLQTCGNYRVDDESSYELSWEGIASVFPNLRGYSRATSPHVYGYAGAFNAPACP